MVDEKGQLLLHLQVSNRQALCFLYKESLQKHFATQFSGLLDTELVKLQKPLNSVMLVSCDYC